MTRPGIEPRPPSLKADTLTTEFGYVYQLLLTVRSFKESCEERKDFAMQQRMIHDDFIQYCQMNWTGIAEIKSGMYIVPYSPPRRGGNFFKSFGKIFKLYRWEKKKKGRERRKRRKRDEKTKREKKKGRKRDKRG